MDYQRYSRIRGAAPPRAGNCHPANAISRPLLEVNHQFVRKDFSQEVWQGPPVGAFSFWTGRVPAANEKLKPRFDDDLLEECFQRLEGQTEPSRVNFRYIVALLLMRRKRFRYETSVIDDGIGEDDAALPAHQRHA